MVKNLPSMWETWVPSIIREDPLEKEMATHSTILAWRIPWTESTVAWWTTVHGVAESDTTKRLTHTHTHTHTQYRASQVALVVKNPPANAGDIRDMSSIPGLGRSPGGVHGNLFQYSCLETPMDRVARKAIVHGVGHN